MIYSILINLLPLGLIWIQLFVYWRQAERRYRRMRDYAYTLRSMLMRDGFYSHEIPEPPTYSEDREHHP